MFELVKGIPKYNPYKKEIFIPSKFNTKFDKGNYNRLNLIINVYLNFLRI